MFCSRKDFFIENSPNLFKFNFNFETTKTFFFFANVCAQSFYISSPIGVKDLYTVGPHGLLSCFITGVLFVFSTSGRAISYPLE